RIVELLRRLLHVVAEEEALIVPGDVDQDRLRPLRPLEDEGADLSPVAQVAVQPRKLREERDPFDARRLEGRLRLRLFLESPLRGLGRELRELPAQRGSGVVARDE